MVGTNPQHLLSSHQDSVEMFGWVKEDLDVTDATLLPLAKVPVPSVQLGTFLEQDFLILLPGLCLHLRDSQLHKDEVWFCTLNHQTSLNSLTKRPKYWSSAFYSTSGSDTIGSK